MAAIGTRTLKAARRDSEDAVDALMDQLAALRKEIAEISEAVNDYSGHTLGDVQHTARALAKEVRQQGAVALRQANRQAHLAGKAIQENPVPVIAILGGIALLSALLLARD
ncbi:MAG TPA: hypothetical protein VIL88_11230 [Devosia sp.]|jgi:ElaB/YqjD/DUF883 family membrane-anchored ribosome-binding protein|uniref:hypothetical protein n=1 Tax=Devosia sp. TaxID=1871048 RepID=UPI002F956AED